MSFSQGHFFPMALAAMGAKGKSLLHGAGAMGTGKFLRGDRPARGGRQWWVENLLILLGEIGTGLPELGHPMAYFLRYFREFLRPKENQGQDQNNNQLFERNAEHEPP